LTVELAGLTDEDVRQTMLRALRLLAVLAVVGLALAWWKLGWQRFRPQDCGSGCG
jgi:hypothetical protein